MIAVIYIIYWSSQRDGQYREITMGYHLASLKHIAVINEEIQLLRLHDLVNNVPQESGAQPPARSKAGFSIVNEWKLISSAADRLQDLQRRYAEPQFAPPLARLQSSLDVFRNHDPNVIMRLFDEEAAVETLLSQLQQLERLHLIAYEELVVNEDSRKQRDRIITVTALLIILLSASTIVGYLLFQVRAALQRQHQAEHELRTLNTELDQRVRERTRELKDAMSEADRANRAKSEFLSRMSHELRTPMNAVLGATQLLEYSRDSLDDKQRKYVELIKSGGGHLLELINEVLDLARIESGKYELQLGQVNLGQIVAECIGLIGPVIDDRGLQLKNNVGADNDCLVTADPKCLRQVLLNLMSNAVKYNRDGGQIILDCDRSTPGRSRISVRDTGPGIDPADQARIFQPFIRLDKDVRVEGTGIGLAVSRQLLELMGGELRLESVPGQGSTFWVELDSVNRETGDIIRDQSRVAVS